MKTVCQRLLLPFVCCALAAAPLAAATLTTLTAGLRAPARVIFSTKGNLLVAESGIGPNTGRISIVDPVTGARRTLLDRLPSGFSIPDGAPAGPSGLAMRGRTLYVSIGLGDAVMNGSAPGTQVPNPHASSPIFSSVLAVHFSADVEMKTAGFALTLADQWALKNTGKVELSTGGGNRLTIELIADFPDYVPEPVPANAANVRQSNPFGIALLDNALYVSDASTNSVRSIDLPTGTTSTLTHFAPLPNTRGFGPPVVEAVPDSIHVADGNVIVTLLSGFPFPIGQSQVRSVDVDTGSSVPVITGLTSAIDVLPVSNGGYMTLEFSSDMLNPALPGSLKWFANPDAAPVVISNGLISPTSMARDASTGAVFVTEIFTGRIVKVAP